MKRFKADNIPKYTEAQLKAEVRKALETELAKVKAGYKANLEAIDVEFENYEKDKDKMSSDAEGLVFLLAAVVLWKEFGFSKGRLDRFFGRVEEVKQMLSEGSLTWYDIRLKADKLNYVCRNESGRVVDLPEGYEKEKPCEYFRRR